MPLLDHDNTQALYQRIAPHYHKHAVVQERIENELLSRLDIISIDIKHILNLGCGTGASTKTLAKAYPKAKLSLLDHSEQMLKQAKKNKPWFRKVQYLNENANNLSLEANSVDLVISNLMLPNCSEPDAVFKQVQRVTRENGLFSFTSLGPDSFKELRAACSAAGVECNDLAFGHLTDMHDLGDGLVRAGLREPVMDVDYFTLSFNTFDELWQELEYTGNIFQSFSEEQKNRIGKKYISDPDEQSYSVTFEVVYGQAWAGDGASRARTPDEVHIPASKIGTRHT